MCLDRKVNTCKQRKLEWTSGGALKEGVGRLASGYHRSRRMARSHRDSLKRGNDPSPAHLVIDWPDGQMLKNRRVPANDLAPHWRGVLTARRPWSRGGWGPGFEPGLPLLVRDNDQPSALAGKWWSTAFSVLPLHYPQRLPSHRHVAPPFGSRHFRSAEPIRLKLDPVTSNHAAS